MSGGTAGRLDGAHQRDADWAGLRVVVAGLGVSGFAAADALLERGARVIVVDGGDAGRRPAMAERARILDILGVDVRLGAGARRRPARRPAPDLVVTSPGLAPRPAAARWRRRRPASRSGARSSWPGGCGRAAAPAPWLTVTGTNGKTTTVQMLASILRAAGLRAAAAGNVGTPVLEAVLDPEPYDVLAVELSSFQLHWSHSLAPHASRRASTSPPTTSTGTARSRSTPRAKGKVYARHRGRLRLQRRRTRAPSSSSRTPTSQEGCRAIGFTLGIPGLSHARRRRRRPRRPRLRRAAPDLRGRAGHPRRPARRRADARPRTTSPTPSRRRPWRGPTASPPAAVRDGLRAFAPEPHRIAEVGDGRRRRATSTTPRRPTRTPPRASLARLRARRVGRRRPAQGRRRRRPGARAAADRLRGVVLIGARPRADRRGARPTRAGCPRRRRRQHGHWSHGPGRGARRARSPSAGDVVLLAPAAASMDMFANYGARGDAFARRGPPPLAPRGSSP